MNFIPFSQSIQIAMEIVKEKASSISDWAAHTFKKVIFEFNEGSIDESRLFGDKVSSLLVTFITYESSNLLLNAGSDIV